MGVTARATKRQVKEVRAMLDGTDRNSDEKLRLLNAKYLQQVCHIPSSLYFMFPAWMSVCGALSGPCLLQLAWCDEIELSETNGSSTLCRCQRQRT